MTIYSISDISVGIQSESRESPVVNGAISGLNLARWISVLLWQRSYRVYEAAGKYGHPFNTSEPLLCVERDRV